MSIHVGPNETPYNTADLERLASGAAELLSPSRGQPWLYSRTSFVHRTRAEALPVRLALLGPDTLVDRLLESGGFGDPFEMMQRSLTYVALDPFKGCHVLSPEALARSLTPLEALSLQGVGAVLPRDVVIELLWALLTQGGHRLCTTKVCEVPSEVGLYSFCRSYLEHLSPEERSVRIDGGKAPYIASWKRMLTAYWSGGALRGMPWKRWIQGHMRRRKP